jgi:hypothetical protein
MIIEQRIYTLKPGKTATYLALYQEKGLAVQKHHLGRLVGYFTSEYGELNQITHLWAYDDHADRARRRSALFADKQWIAVVDMLYAMIERMENMILTPTAFSPLA